MIGFVLFLYLDGWGADWEWYDSSKRVEGFYYDKKSLTYPSKNIARVWQKIVYNEEGVNNIVEKRGEKFKSLSYDKALVEYDCPEGKQRLLSLTRYSHEDEVLFSDDVPDMNWSSILPDSIANRLYTILCKQPRPEEKPTKTKIRPNQKK